MIAETVADYVLYYIGLTDSVENGKTGKTDFGH